MSDPSAELAFQNEIIAHLTADGWLLGTEEYGISGVALVHVLISFD
jgi:hypothetical protein